jgi:hypothetical protein
MTLDEIKSKLESIVDLDSIGLEVFFLLDLGQEENEDQNIKNTILKKANIKESVKKELIQSYLNGFNMIVENDDLSLIPLSSADDRKEVIFRYDISEKPKVFKYFDDIRKYDIEEIEIPKFKFNQDDLDNLEGYFVSIGTHANNIIIYRKQMSVNLFKQGKIYLVKGHNTQFDKIDQEFLRVDTKIDVLAIGDEIIINNLSVLERHYDFRLIIENEANKTLENIDKIDILENIDVLKERVEDTRFARKLSKISTTSPVFKLPKEHIMEFVQNHEALGSEFRYSEDNDTILLDTKKSQNYFLKLMNDDFLHSELTDYDYMTPAKDRL